MKLRYILLITLFLILPINTKALEYESKLSGENIFSSMPDNEENLFRKYRNLYIDITNIETIDSFNMYIKYDKDIMGLTTCNLLNYIGEGCHITSAKEVYYEYKHSKGYNELFNNYNFYRVGFKPTSTTPEAGTTTVEVYFKNAIDINGNPITIKPSTMTYTIVKNGIILNTNNKEEENITTNDNIEKSNNNFIKSLEIKDYTIEFDKYINNYRITIDENINNLDIKFSLEDEKATYKITGADNLKENNYTVSIEVTSESGEKNVYTITSKINNTTINNNKNIIEKEENTEIIPKDTKKIKIKKEHIIIAILSIILITIIITIINNKSNNKMNKMFEGL